ncbi:hypothetical protein OQY15_09675 [Pedobacter sp. MC2016-15]|uniref:hypothetical protein n=1 Tax=Pedobacter sp. MC2016-15 TaxID=2994473 RepID=UPI0022450E9F|nr:hypothetical protein [Pedobacter sp. MC2016-15]MCX2479358.1 hypothetical protein [Pedobacter sp. MC2016-15]
MKWISKSPEDQYILFNHNGLPIFVDSSDYCEETIEQASNFCDYYGYSQRAETAVAVYFVRGHRHQCEYSEVLVGVLEADTLPVDLYEVVHCITFWNAEGRTCFNYPQNKGSKESYRNFILKCIASDCRVYVEPCEESYITGRSGDHVWISDKHSGERIMIIHFNELLINHL